jgi:hypothetical protein
MSTSGSETSVSISQFEQHFKKQKQDKEKEWKNK